jgi:hypothetical protein
VAKARKKYWIILGFFIFAAYVFVAARPIPMETILVPRWLSSLDSDYSARMAADNTAAEEYLVPFTLGNRFGYVDTQGQFVINRPVNGSVSLSEDRWAEFEAIPDAIDIRSPRGESLTVIENDRGYPLFLDGKIFLVGENQTSLALADESGEIRWTCDFAAPLTTIDAKAGLVLAGFLDGTVELLNASGKRVYTFSPGGSRLAVILGCAVSGDGSRLAIVSGYDDQRFLVLERFGDSYRVVYHEFLGDGFRHAVHISFIADDSWIAFERQGGIGLYELETRQSVMVPLSGAVTALDETGGGGVLFVITSLGGQSKSLAAIRLPGIIVMEAAFHSENAFFSRRGSKIYVGGGTTLASFELDMR